MVNSGEEMTQRISSQLSGDVQGGTEVEGTEGDGLPALDKRRRTTACQVLCLPCEIILMAVAVACGLSSWDGPYLSLTHTHTCMQECACEDLNSVHTHISVL